MELSHLTEKEAFKAGFRAFCKEAGLSESEVLQRMKTAGFLDDYGHQLNKFYNPWSKAWNEPASDNIEKGLQYAGRAAMGLGGGAAALAGGITAAAGKTVGSGLASWAPFLAFQGLNTSANLAGNAGLLAAAAPIAGGLALGGGLGMGAAKMMEPDVDDDDVKAKEIEQAYRIQSQRLKARRDYEKYRAGRG